MLVSGREDQNCRMPKAVRLFTAFRIRQFFYENRKPVERGFCYDMALCERVITEILKTVGQIAVNATV